MTDAEIKDFLEANGHGSGRSFVAAARAIRAAALEEAAVMCDEEYIGTPQDAADEAYQNATIRCARAIRSLGDVKEVK